MVLVKLAKGNDLVLKSWLNDVAVTVTAELIVVIVLTLALVFMWLMPKFMHNPLK